MSFTPLYTEKSEASRCYTTPRSGANRSWHQDWSPGLSDATARDHKLTNRKSSPRVANQALQSPSGSVQGD